MNRKQKVEAAWLVFILCLVVLAVINLQGCAPALSNKEIKRQYDECMRAGKTPTLERSFTSGRVILVDCRYLR